MKTKFDSLSGPIAADSCNDCHLNTKKAESCIVYTLIIGKKQYPRNRHYSPEANDPETDRCHDCGIKIGGIHHSGCDSESCPKCSFQLISCTCDHKWHVWDTESFLSSIEPKARRIFETSRDNEMKRILMFQIISKKSKGEMV